MLSLPTIRQNPTKSAIFQEVQFLLNNILLFDMAIFSPIVAFLTIALAAATSATQVQFNNRCNRAIDVIKTANSEQPRKECRLNPGQSWTGTYNSNGMNFKDGWSGKSLAEFSFNSWNSMDFYDLSVIVGYDTPMQIAPSTGGPTVTCRGAGCPDAYLYPTDDTKTHGCPTGGKFQVTFCP